jgi:hypothetical protein
MTNDSITCDRFALKSSSVRKCNAVFFVMISWHQFREMCSVKEFTMALQHRRGSDVMGCEFLRIEQKFLHIEKRFIHRVQNYSWTEVTQLVSPSLASWPLFKQTCTGGPCESSACVSESEVLCDQLLWGKFAFPDGSRKYGAHCGCLSSPHLKTHVSSTRELSRLFSHSFLPRFSSRPYLLVLALNIGYCQLWDIDAVIRMQNPPVSSGVFRSRRRTQVGDRVTSLACSEW